MCIRDSFKSASEAPESESPERPKTPTGCFPEGTTLTAQVRNKSTEKWSVSTRVAQGPVTFGSHERPQNRELRRDYRAGRLVELPRRRGQQQLDNNILTGMAPHITVSKSVRGVFFENSIVCRWIVSANLGAAFLSRDEALFGVWLVVGCGAGIS